jgi:ABC-type phosphate transport system substrate-binding protein
MIQNYDTDVISQEEVRLVFTLRLTRFDSGYPIKVYVLPKENESTKDFAYRFIGMSVDSWFDVLDAQEVTGRLNVHTIVGTDKDMIKQISKTPYSIGYTNDAVIYRGADLIVVHHKRL